MIRAVYRRGAIEPLDEVPADWREGQSLIVQQSEEPLEDADNWLNELNASAAHIPDCVHDELAAVLQQLEAESKELVRREMERNA